MHRASVHRGMRRTCNFHINIDGAHHELYKHKLLVFNCKISPQIQVLKAMNRHHMKACSEWKRSAAQYSLNGLAKRKICISLKTHYLIDYNTV